MQIKKMPEAERPQEKMLYGGAGCLSNSELLALIIRTGTGDKSAVRLADEVISYTSENTGGLGAAEVRELTEIDGIGAAKACSIVAAMELSKRMISDHQGAGLLPELLPAGSETLHSLRPGSLFWEAGPGPSDDSGPEHPLP